MNPLTVPVINHPNWVFRCGYMANSYWFAVFAEDNPDGSANLIRAKGANGDYIASAHEAAQAVREVEHMLQKRVTNQIPKLQEGEEEAAESLEFLFNTKDPQRPNDNTNALLQATINVHRLNMKELIQSASEAQRVAKRAMHLAMRSIISAEDALPNLGDLIEQTSEFVAWSDQRKALEALHDGELEMRPEKTRKLLRGL